MILFIQYFRLNLKIKSYLLPLVFFVVIIFSGFFLYSIIPAQASAFNASGVLGEYDISGNPSYTKIGINNSDSASDIGFDGLSKIALDSVNHRLFIADTNNNRVLIYLLDSNNNLTTTNATYVIGQTDFYKKIATQVSATGLKTPSAVAYDATDNYLWVSDSGHGRILGFSVPTGTNLTGISATVVKGEPNFTTSGWGNGPAYLHVPLGLAMSNNDTILWVADSANNRVLGYNNPTVTLTGQAATYLYGQTGYGSAHLAPNTTQSGLNNPTDILYDSVDGRFFIADSGNNRIIITGSSGGHITSPAIHILGQTIYTTNAISSAQNGMNNPQGISYDSLNKRLFVSDSGNNRVLIFNTLTTTIINGENALNVLGQDTYDVNTANTTQNGLSNPVGLIWDNASNNLFVSDSGNNRVLIFNTLTTTIINGENASLELGQYDNGGSPLYTVGGANNSILTDDVNALGLDAPNGVNLDPINHRLFVVDSLNERILVFPLDLNNNISSITPSYVLGQPNFTSNVSQTTREGLSNPRRGSYDPVNNRFFIADRSNPPAGGGIRVLVYNVDPLTMYSGEPAMNVLGQADFTSSVVATTQSGFSNVSETAYDSINSRLFVTDFLNNRIMVFDDVSPSTIHDGMLATYVIGQADFMTNTIGSSDNGVKSPMSVYYDATHYRLFVGDYGNHRVLVFNVPIGTDLTGISATYVLGEPDFNTTTANLTQSGVSGVDGFAYDSANERMFIADETYNRVTVYNVDPLTMYSGEPAMGVLGQVDFNSNVATGTQSGLNYVHGLEYDPLNNRLYISDYFNNRVMIYSLVKITTSSLPDGVINSPYLQQIQTISTQKTSSLSLYSGSLPDGFSFDPLTGIISGTPTTANTSTFTIEARDTDSGSGNYFLDRKTYVFNQVADNILPVITLNGSSSISIQKGSSPAYIDAGAIATDNIDGDITSHLVVTGSVDIDTPGIYVLRYNVQDSSGNHANEVTRIIQVKRVYGSGGIIYGCKDTAALNYDAFASSKPSLCQYATITPVISSPAQILGSGKCSSALIITDNLRQGDKNGVYSAYNKGIIKQVNILQAHINRILAASYKQAAGPVDGIYGPLTKEGVKRLQTALNTVLKPTPLLKIDGIVGPFTKGAINNSCGI